MDKIMLKDIAGYEDEKKELSEIIDTFHRYETYKTMGAYMPKGLILSGVPGVGKTLFARVLANEINAPFYHVDGADISSHGGVKRLKSIFRKARRTTPSVVFIDEINMFVGDDDYITDRTQRNLSALLKLIDGMSSNDGVLFVGATSNKSGLDSALMRSGRMDKHICLGVPNSKSRFAILEHYLSGIAMETDGIDLARIAAKTQGFTAADIKTLVNESATECIHDNTPLSDETFLLNIRKINAQDINRASDYRNLKLYASHDVGHMLVSYALRGTFDDMSVEFITDGNSSIASLFSVRDGDEYDDDDEPEIKPTADSLADVLDKTAILLGGAAGEDVLMGERFLTSANDVKCACKLLDRAFDNGLFGFDYVNPCFYYYNEISRELLERTERKTAEVLSEQYERAKQIVAAQRDTARSIVEELMQRKELAKAQTLTLLTR